MKNFDIGLRRRALPIKIIEPRPVEEKKFQPSKKRKWPKVVSGIIVLIIVILSLFAFYVLPEVRIEVEARTEPVARDFEVRVDKNLQEPNADALAVPGQILAVELTESKTYNSTGIKNIGKKASGFVHIYNFTKTTLILRAGTTVLSSSGRMYYFTQDVSGIRPTAKIGLADPEVDESSLIPPVPVVAAMAGTEYNLPKGARLEIENEVLGQSPETLYAVVAEDIAGGTTKEVNVVSENDIARAHQSLSNDLIEKAKLELTRKYSVTVLDNAMAADVLEPTASVQASAEANSFEASVKVRARAFVFNELEVREIALARIKRLLPQTKVLDEGIESKFSTQFANVSLDAGAGVLVAHYEGKIVYVVQKDDLINKVKGKNVEEIKEVLLSRPEIESAKIKFYPFWVKHAPKIAGKIKLEVISE
ncbi:MAG: hypothetical protein Q8R08_04450 [bacterium]|nr:hypothetical protein [bacterium]